MNLWIAICDWEMNVSFPSYIFAEIKGWETTVILVSFIQSTVSMCFWHIHAVKCWLVLNI